ncbi:hypothetical protein RJT34_13946 [Clitoria ternatea]|uniref:DDE Tnp4 domain-containing protein n=1 Tax=Clitoria ternatea TaxID=43366 RepID=A0AAN9PMQ3_CLITE
MGSSVFDSSLQFLLSLFSLVDFDRRVLTARHRCSSPVIHLFATDRACRVAPQRKCGFLPFFLSILSTIGNKSYSEHLELPNLRFPYPPEGKYYLVDSGYPSFKGFLGPYRNTRSDSHDLDILENMENINELQNEEQNFSGGDNHDIYDHEDWQEPTQTDVRYMEEVRNVIRDQLSRQGR